MRQQLDFSILDNYVNNLQLLVFSDDSIYVEPPKNPVVQIKFPGFKDWNEVLITPSTVNRFTTVQLKYTTTKQDFPDGVYEVKYSIMPHNKLTITKGYVRSVKFNKDFASYLEKIGENEASTIDKLWQIELYLQGARYNAENGDINNAVLKFSQAQKELSRLVNCE